MLRQLLATQGAAGAFGRTPELTALAQQALPNWADQSAELERACIAIMPADDPAVMTAAIATVEGLLLLRSVFAADAATWKRAADKAVRYVAKLSGRTVAEIENWMDNEEGARSSPPESLRLCRGTEFERRPTA